LALLITELPAVEGFLTEGLITGVLSTIKGGKEATTYLCRAHPSLGAKYAVAKVYHERKHRNFNNATTYAEGRLILNGQVRRAVEGKTDFGRKAQTAIWVNYEYETLCTLYDAGADVPEPYASDDEAVLMEYVGDGAAPAPQLQNTALEPHEARPLLERLLWNVECWLAAHVVHADLSAYNVLYWKGRGVVIDFPQSVDPRFNPAARRLLERDLRNLGNYFVRCGLEFDPVATADDLWRRFTFGELG
jgi:RIO kinase 1